MAQIRHSFGYKSIWFALKGWDILDIPRQCKNMKNIQNITWESGIKEIENDKFYRKILLSGAYHNWTFIIGKGLADASQADTIISLLLKFSMYAEEVYYFCSHRTIGLYGFAKAIHGKVIRLYCYSGENGYIYKNIGEKTKEEKTLLLNFPKKEEELFEEGFEEINEDHILDLAEQFSIHPQSLIQLEEKRSLLVEVDTWQHD